MTGLPLRDGGRRLWHFIIIIIIIIIIKLENIITKTEQTINNYWHAYTLTQIAKIVTKNWRMKCFFYVYTFTFIAQAEKNWDNE